ncbi:MAG: xanthine dehydrogenase family protein molybdopterin-binding subunit [Pseudomonadaceae bacterium]|nr:xanthine dehydrogenase family protein molybdopterin-binding subunit [Pseudomonadaceae bacterium]
MAAQNEFKVIGTSPVRPDGVDKVTGRAEFAADQTMSNAVVGKVLRSPHAHANIKSIDLTDARALPGVYAVICGADFPEAGGGDIGGEGGGSLKDVAQNVMARGKALYHGHAVAAVAAASNEAADAALAAIKVEYEALPPVLDVVKAMEDDSPLLDDQCFTKNLPETPDKPSNIAAVMNLVRGDVDEGFAEADEIIEQEYKIPMAHQGYIEPHACCATINEEGKATVWCSTQGPFEFRQMTAGICGMKLSQVRIVSSEIGGGFGGKTVVYLEPVAVMLSKHAGRPVKMTMTREEVFRATGPTSGTVVRVKVGAKKDGTLTAATAWLAYEAGAFAGAPMGPGAMTILAPYKIDNFKISAFDVLVNKPKVAAYRAPGAPQSMHAMESALDDMARKLGMDPLDLRMVNAAEEGTTAPYGAKFPVIGLKACLEAAKKHPNYTKKLNDGVGRGVAVGFWFNVGGESSAEAHVNEDGSVTVLEANPDIGGSRASMCLMAAETLGVPYESVKTYIGDTETSGWTMVTGGSRVTFATGMAVVQACEDIIAQCKARAASTWGVDESMVEWRDGEAVPAPGANIDVEPLTLADIAGKSAKTGGPILGRAALNAQGAGPSFSVNIAEVEVDKETGRTELLGFTAVQDAGRAIHKAYVEGQLQGGAAQGIGWALNEEYIFNADGVMENAGFLDYRIPVASDLPMIDTVVIEVPNPSHPYGVRGVGETPIVAPLAAVSNAVADAVGFRIADLPLSPPKVLEAIDSRA